MKYTLFIRDIAFPAEAEYSYFSADLRLKILLYIFLDFIIWLWLVADITRALIG